MVINLLVPTVYLPQIGGQRVNDKIYVDEAGNEVLKEYN